MAYAQEDTPQAQVAENAPKAATPCLVRWRIAGQCNWRTTACCHQRSRGTEKTAILKSAALLLLSFHLLSAAVDCATPLTRQQQVVCATPELMNLDQQLWTVYQKALAATPVDGRRQFEHDQASWEVSSGGCWDRVACLKSRYIERIALFQGGGLTAGNGTRQSKPGSDPGAAVLPKPPSQTEAVQSPALPPLDSAQSAGREDALAAPESGVGAASSVGARCLPYSPASVTLTGTVTQKVFPGKPNFASVENGDEPENVWILDLSSPLCVNQQTAGDHTFGGHADVRDVQLLIDTEQTHDKVRILLGRSVTVTGSLDEAASMHNHTAVLLSVLDLASTQQEPTGESTSPPKQVSTPSASMTTPTTPVAHTGFLSAIASAVSGVSSGILWIVLLVYVLWGTYWGCQIIYPRMMTWYKSSTWFIFGKNPMEILMRQIAFGLQVRFWAIVIGMLVGCLGGAVYMQFLRTAPSVKA
jgi:hypothetical protein